MSNKIRVKDIADKAGVSAGTVDRVLHNRGNISNKSRQAVEKVLKEFNYTPNIHMSSFALKKKYTIVVATPNIVKGGYWDMVHKGIARALKEYNNIEVKCKFCFFDQFDLYSCRMAFEKVMEYKPDAVVICPTFRDEAIHLANSLEDFDIPYVFIDSTIEGAAPVAFFASDPFKCGYLMCRLIDNITPDDSEFVLFQTVRIGDSSANTTILRKVGFRKYLREHGLADRVHNLSFSVTEPEKNREFIGDFFKKHPNVHGAIVLSSRGNIIADYLRENNIKGVKLICIDGTDANIKALKSEDIDFLIGQRPQQQGFLAIKTLIQYLIYRSPVTVENYMPIDIITRENVDLHREFDE